MERGPGGDENLQQGGSEEATPGCQYYEVALCCLLFLRALRLSSGGDFFLSLSDADHVVLLYRSKGDQSRRYRAVLVHSTASSLQECLDSFEKMGGLGERSVKVKSQLIEFQEISLVLYTIGGCVLGDAARDVTASPDDVEDHLLRDLLNTGGRLLRITDARRAGLPPGPETSDLVKHLILCTEQASLEAVDQILEEEISNVLKLTSADGAKKLILEMKTLFVAWRGEERKGRCLTAQSEEWKRVLELEVTRLNAVQSRLDLDFTEAALKPFKSLIGRRQSWVRVGDEYQGRATRVRLLKALRTCLVLDANSLETHLDQVEALWGTAACPTLALDMSAGSPEEHLTLLQSLQAALSSQAARKLVVIAKERPAAGAEWFVHQAEATWPLLDPSLLSVQVNLQGQIVPLRYVIDLDAPPVMSDKLLQSLRDPAGGAMKLGEPLPPPQQECYVPRCIRRIRSDASIFPKNIFEFKPQIPWAPNIYLSDHDEEIRSRSCGPSKLGMGGCFEEEDSEGNVTEIFPFTWMCDEEVVVIEGVPGVGKSSFVTAMCSRVKEEFPESWVLRFDMGKHTEFIQGRDFRRPGDITEFLLKGLMNDLERELLEHALYVTGNVFLFLDAFDEVYPDYTAKCSDLLKRIATTVRFRQMVVTTRPVTSEAVQEALLLLGTTTKAFSLPVFSEDQQRLFLRRFCEARGKNVDEEEISSLRQRAGGSALAIPLLCKMAAEVLLHRDDQSWLKYEDPWRKVSLYQLFVEQSISNLLAVKLGLEVRRMPGVERLWDSSAQDHLQNLQALAVRKLMPVSQLPSSLDISSELPDVKLGLVVDAGAASVDFEHRTLAEYFLGCWLARHWRRCPQQLLRQVLSRDGNEFVAATLSWWLFQGLPLHEAVAQGDEGVVRAALMTSGGATVDQGGRSALHVAAMTRGEHRKVVEALLTAKGEDRDQKDDVLGVDAVTCAAMSRNWTFVEVMLEKGEPPEDLTFFEDQTAAREALIQFIHRDLTRVFEYMLRLHGETLDHRLYREGNERGNALLHVAAAENSTAAMKVLMEMGHSAGDQRNCDGDSPLHHSSRRGHEEAARLLLDNGADADAVNEDGFTALMEAAGEGHAEVVKLLLENGADPNIKTRGDCSCTALKEAACRGHAEVVKLLLENGADPNVKHGRGSTALIGACYQGKLEVAKLLLENGADPNVKDEDGSSALIDAVRLGDMEVAKLLMENGADPNITTERGSTVLLDAIRQGNLEVVKLSIDNGADPNVTTGDGSTALMLAVGRGHLEVGKLLIEMGADPNVATENGSTALMEAALQRDLEAVKLLIEKGADPNVGNEDGVTALIQAARRGDLEVVKLLIEKGADPNAGDEYGITALLEAAGRGHHEVVKFLVESGDQVVTEDGFTALMGAGHAEVAKLLAENPILEYMSGHKRMSLVCVFCMLVLIFWLS